MNIGEFRDRVTVKRLTKSADGFGGFTSSQSTVATIWAKLIFTDGDMSFENENVVLARLVAEEPTMKMAYCFG